MKLYRVFNYNHIIKNSPLGIDKNKQLDGRHDIPDLDAVVYVSLSRTSAIAESIQMFRNTTITNEDLEINENTFRAIAELESNNNLKLLDFNDLDILQKLGIKPNAVATHDREMTKEISEKVYDSGNDGFLWWSSIESKWINATLFRSKIKNKISINNIRRLDTANISLIEAAGFLKIKLKY